MKKFFKMITNKWLLKGTTTVILVALVMACYIGINWAVEKINVEDLDFTTKKLYSLSDATKERLKNLDKDITIQLLNMSDYSYVIEYADKYQKASDKVTVEQIGGPLYIEWDEETDSMFMTGPSHNVFEGEIDIKHLF